MSAAFLLHGWSVTFESLIRSSSSGVATPTALMTLSPVNLRAL